MKNGMYQAPKVLQHQPIRFETSQSWNKGAGEMHHDDGNGGINYPLEPRLPKEHDQH